MATFERDFNFDDVFLRSITLGVISEFYRKVRWQNKFSDKVRNVTVPFYYSAKGDDRFMIDAFIDDIVGKRPELNIDPKPRGHLFLESVNTKLNEYSNPNANVEAYQYNEDGTLKKTIGKYRFVPVRLNYSVEIKLETEIDVMKCQQAIWDAFWIYKYFYVDFSSLRLDAVMNIPESLNPTINREIAGVTSTKDILSMKFGLEVNTHYPIKPSESKTIPVNKKVVFKGNIRNLRGFGRKRKFIGTDANDDLDLNSGT